MDPALLRLLSGENTTAAAPIAEDEESGFGDDYFNNKWLIIVPRITGTISLFAVCCVAAEAWMDIRARRREQSVRSSGVLRTGAAKNLSTITNIQLFYQIPLFCFSLALALGTTPAPKGQAIAAVGNVQTCSAQGFLLQFGMHGMYGWDATLSTAYLMMVRYHVSDFRLQSRISYLHFLIWPIALGVSIFPLFQQMYNLNGTICWLEPYPRYCDTDEGVECQRGGKGATVWQTVASSLVFLHLLYTITIMVLLYRAVRALESHTDATTGANTTMSRRSSVDSMVTTATARRRRCSRSIAIQGLLYASGMVITALPTPIYVFLWNMFGVWSNGFSIFAASLVPLVGYVNFVVFMRCRSVENCRTRYGKFLRRAHSWLFDYEVVCRIRCRPKSDSDEAGMPELPEAVNSPGGDNTKASTGTGWSAFQIALQKRSQMLGVSDLGESGLSDFDGCDEAPSLPKRIKSGIEKPPMQPVRYVSEVEDNTSKKNTVLAPAKPVRLASEYEHQALAKSPSREHLQFSKRNNAVDFQRPLQSVLEELEQEECPPKQPQRYVSGFEESLQLESNTERIGRFDYMSEITVDDELNDDLLISQEKPPSQPLRCISEVEIPTVDAFERPEGILEAVEEEASLRASSNPQCCDSQDLDTLRSVDSSCKWDEREPKGNLQGPPSIPTRCVSEVDA